MAKRKPQPAPAESILVPDQRPLPDRLKVWGAALVAEMQSILPVSRLDDLRRQLVEIDAALAPPTIPARPTVRDVVVLRDRGSLTNAAMALDQADVLVVDLETSSLDYRTGEIVGVGFATDDGAWYAPVAHRIEATGELRPDQMPLSVVLAGLELGKRRLVAHNAKFEMHWLLHRGGVDARFVWDTEVAAKLMAPHLPAGLKDVASRELDVPDWGLSKADLKRVQYLPVEIVAPYCAKDCTYTLRLMRRQMQCLS